MSRRLILAATVTAAMLVQTGAAQAAEGLNGAGFGFVWAIPFIGILLCIALGPLLFAHAWEHHQGKISAAWGLAVLIPLLLTHGAPVAATSLTHTALLEYIPFILLLLALFTTAGGILVAGNIHGSPVMNTALLALGAMLASLIGTTGASMVMIRPMLRANDNRKHNVHVFVFFIFLVSNLGGSLTPLGDPPLFLGFLKGVDFFWTTTHLAAETAFAGGIVLALFFAVDTIIYRREGVLPDPTPDKRVRVRGMVNLALIGVIIAAILMSATWKPGVSLHDHACRGRAAERAARPDFVGGRGSVPGADQAAISRGERVLVGTDRGGRQAVRRHLHHDDPGAGHAARRC